MKTGGFVDGLQPYKSEIVMSLLQQQFEKGTESANNLPAAPLRHCAAQPDVEHHLA